MPKFANVSLETAALQRREAMETRPQDRYAGRRKFTGCRQCGSVDGMQAVHRETIARMDPYDINRNRWYHGPDGDEYVFHQCWNCNWARIIPDDFTSMTFWEVLDWRDNTDPMASDYAALAAEEPVSQVEDSRDSAGLER